jgi:hypothetical protein
MRGPRAACQCLQACDWRRDGVDLAGAHLYDAQFLNCAQLIVTRNWQSAFRDDALACGASLPDRMPSG